MKPPEVPLLALSLVEIAASFVVGAVRPARGRFILTTGVAALALALDPADPIGDLASLSRHSPCARGSPPRVERPRLAACGPSGPAPRHDLVRDPRPALLRGVRDLDRGLRRGRRPPHGRATRGEFAQWDARTQSSSRKSGDGCPADGCTEPPSSWSCSPRAEDGRRSFLSPAVESFAIQCTTSSTSNWSRRSSGPRTGRSGAGVPGVRRDLPPRAPGPTIPTGQIAPRCCL